MKKLPPDFKNLEPFAKWALETEIERKELRVNSTIEEIRLFCDAIMPQAEAIFEYLNQFPLNDMPEDARQLQLMTLSLAEVSSSYEIYNQPTVPDALGFERLPPTEQTNKMYW